MSGTALFRPVSWRTGEIVQTIIETPRVRSLIIDVPGWERHRPGQYLDVRLTTPDGSQITRSYSIASAPEDDYLQITVERLPGSEASRYLTDQIHAGDRLELRGPNGGHFIWEHQMGGPLMLIAGGSGIAPLMAMIRHRLAYNSPLPVRLLYSSRSVEDIIYRDELDRLAATYSTFEVVHTLTRAQPPGWTGYTRRIDPELLEETAWSPDLNPLIYVCGSTDFVETVTAGLFARGYSPPCVRTERFGRPKI